MDILSYVKAKRTQKNIDQHKIIDGHGFVYNTDNNLRAWRASRAKLDSGIEEIVNLNIIGDSITEGYTSGETVDMSTYNRSFASRVRDAINVKYGDVGNGFIPNQYPVNLTPGKWVYTGTWATVGVYGWNYGANGKYVGTEPNSTATLNFNGTGVVVLIEPASSGSTFDISIDGGTAQSFPVQFGSTAKEFIFDGLADGSHNVVITHTGTSGKKLSLLGAYELKGNSGIRTNMIGTAGAVVDYFVRDFNLNACIDYWQPKLSIISLLANDYNNQTNLSTFEVNWRTLIDRAKTQGDVLITTTGGMRQTEKAIPMSDYKKIVVDLAIEKDCALLDIASRWGDSWDNASSDWYIDPADDVHPTRQGHQDIANAILEVIL